MIKKIKYCIIFTIFFAALCCKEKASSSKNQLANSQHEGAIPYNLNMPDRIVNLPYELREISGLTCGKTNDVLHAVNDEKGILYSVDSSTGEIIGKHNFAGLGDYEGIEMVDSYFVVAKSNGDLLKFTSDDSALPERIKTSIKSKNNLEGLGYQPTSKLLLLACKDNANLNQESKTKGKAVFSLNLNDPIESLERVFLIKDKNLLNWYTSRYGEISKKAKSRITSFSPSGIAIHPLSGEAYITSARGDMMVVMQGDEIIHVELLNIEKSQIEGICFSQNGTLYISSEGVSSPARIFTFNMN